MNQIFIKLKRYINLNELLFDLIVSVFAFLIMFIFVPSGRPMILELGSEQILGLLFILQFFVSMYIGILFIEFRPHMKRSKALKKLVKFFFFIALNGIFIILLITFALYVDFPRDYFGRETNLLIIFILSTPLVMGFFLGFPKDSYNEMMPILWAPLGVFVPLLFYTCLVIGWKINWFIGLLSFPILVALVGAPIFCQSYLAKKITISEKVRKRLSILIKDITLPACMAVAFIYWQELTMMGIFRSASNNNISVTMIHIYLALSLGGIIPIRIMLAITPPFKPVNVFLGAVAFILYIISVSGYIHFQIPAG